MVAKRRRSERAVGIGDEYAQGGIAGLNDDVGAAVAVEVRGKRASRVVYRLATGADPLWVIRVEGREHGHPCDEECGDAERCARPHRTASRSSRTSAAWTTVPVVSVPVKANG